MALGVGKLRRHRFRTGFIVAVVCGALLTPVSGPPAEAAGSREAAAGAAEETISVDGQDEGRAFDGVGGVSAGASTRLLYDYPERERSQVLDYMFKPGYGAAMDLLKVEIGSDTNSTSGSEPSHMREPGKVDCGQGYEWWLMKEAKKRNPGIKLAGLEWGAPGWLDGGFWSQDNIDYLLAWLGCADQHGLTIDYMGGWNERGYNVDWFVDFGRALEKHYPDVQLIGADEIGRWDVADDMAANDAFNEAVDVVGVHFACGNRSQRRSCNSTQTARDLGKPLWMSEVSALSHEAGAAPAARSINRMYIDAQLTGYMTWSPVSAWYANLPIADTGMIAAEWPWSGHYKVGETVWSFAHTTQFTEPGWRYLDSGSGYLESGASYVSLKPDDGDDFSTVIETMDATEPTTVKVDVEGGLRSDAVQLWSTDLGSDDRSDQFVHQPEIKSENGSFTVTLEPGHVYTLSTTTGQDKGDGRPRADVHEQMDMTYREDFDQLQTGDLAPYFSDVNGSFTAAPCAGDRDGTCYRQQTPRKPVQWATAGDMDPTTIAGDPRWWGDYQVSTKFLLEEAGYVELLGRVSNHATPWGTTTIGGYHLRVSSDGGWRLYSEDYHDGEHTLASGKTAIGTGSWHTMTLRMRGATVSVEIDDEPVASVTDKRQRTGGIGLRVEGFKHAQFDDVQVAPAGAQPLFVPQSETTATATSETGFSGGYLRNADKVVDDRPETFWQSAPGQEGPHSVTVDLGKPRKTHGIAVQPRYDASSAGMPGRYKVYVSGDGENFEEAADGTWSVDKSTKVVHWQGGEPRTARYVRLESAGRGCQAAAAVAELKVALTPMAGGDFGADPETPPDYAFIPQSQMSATASSWHPGYEPAKAIDGDCGTMWHTPFRPDNPPPPHELTIDLGGSHTVEALVYRPRQDGNGNGVVTEYRLSVSSDGETFTEVASGQWTLDSTAKTASPSEPVQARYVRLEAVEAGGGFGSAAEVNVAHLPE